MEEPAAGDKSDRLRGIAATLLYMRDAYRHRLQHPLSCSTLPSSHASPAAANTLTDLAHSCGGSSQGSALFSVLEQAQLRWLVGRMALQLQAIYPTLRTGDSTILSEDIDEANEPTAPLRTPVDKAQTAAVQRTIRQNVPATLQQRLPPSPSPFPTSAEPTLELPTSFADNYSAQSYLVPTSLDACYTIYKHRHEQPTTPHTAQSGSCLSGAVRHRDVATQATQSSWTAPRRRLRSRDTRASSVDVLYRRLTRDKDATNAIPMPDKQPCMSGQVHASQRTRRAASESALSACTAPALHFCNTPSTMTLPLRHSTHGTPDKSQQQLQCEVLPGFSDMPSVAPLSHRSSQQETTVDGESATGSSRHPSLLMRRPHRLRVPTSHTQRLQSSSTLSLSGSLLTPPPSSSHVAASRPITPCEATGRDSVTPTTSNPAMNDDHDDVVAVSIAHKTSSEERRAVRQGSPVTDSPERKRRELSDTRVPINDQPGTPSSEKEDDAQNEALREHSDVMHDTINTAEGVRVDVVTTSHASAYNERVPAELHQSQPFSSIVTHNDTDGSYDTSPRLADVDTSNAHSAIYYKIDRSRLEDFVCRLQEVTNAQLSLQELAGLDLRYAIPGVCEVHRSNDVTSDETPTSASFALPLVAGGAERVVTLDELPHFVQLVESKVQDILQQPCQYV